MSELYHWGIKGMRWYKRLYQNKDGTLTPLGKVRYRKSNSERSSATVDSKASEPKTSRKEYITNRNNLRRLDLSKMDDATLMKLKQRLQLEKEVAGLISTLAPKKVSAAKKIVDSLGDAVLKGAGTRLTNMIGGNQNNGKKKNNNG